MTISANTSPNISGSISGHLEFDRLPATERLVLITLRARIDGCRGGSVETLYRIACGLAWVERAMASFDALTEILAGGARRRLAIGRLADACVTRDEHCLLALLAAHQLGQTGQAQARVRWLVRRDFLAPLAVHAGAFAVALQRSGRRLSTDWLESPPCAPRIVTGTVYSIPPATLGEPNAVAVELSKLSP